MLTPQIAYYLNKKIDELKVFYETDILSEELFICEKIILFFAVFYNYFPSSVKEKINLLYCKYVKDNSNKSNHSFVNKFAALIILQILFQNDFESYEYFCKDLLDNLSHHASSTRSVFSFFTSCLLDDEINPGKEIVGYTLKEHLIDNCEYNISKRHGGNIESYALITFLNIPKEEKIDIFNKLYDFAIESEHAWDYKILEQLKNGDNKIKNPFYGRYIKIQQIILNEISGLKTPRKFNYFLDDELEIFSQYVETKTVDCFNFEDKRLNKYLKI